jgi:hypothetical protein
MTALKEQPALAIWDELERVLARLERHAGPENRRERFSGNGFDAEVNGRARDSALRTQGGEEARPERWNPAARLRETFGLTGFELDTLLLCAGFVLDRRFAAAGAGQPEPAGASGLRPTFGLAVSALDEPHWSAASRLRPLRYWHLLEVGPGPLLHAPLEIDERVLLYLLGVPAVDERLDVLMHPLAGDEAEIESHSAGMREAVLRGALHWRQSRNLRGPLLLTGARPSERTALFRALCRETGVRSWTMDAAELPEAAADRERLARDLTREFALWPVALLVRTARLENPLPLAAWLERVDAPVAVEVETGSPAERLRGVRLDTPAMSAAERRQLWVGELGPLAEGMLAGQEKKTALDAMVETFALDPAEIRLAAESVREEAMLEGSGADAAVRAAWRICRTAARRSLDDLAARFDSPASWDDLVLPDGQVEILRQIVANARQTSVVLGDWGFAGRYARGLGLSALFAGASGTGKTMAAGIIARELDRDLYQIDLATVVSKYIGETEKHLRRVFDAAERSGAILLFDEADALFGKRSQVRDSHDRYANLEISYLLQRMESYRGIAILTTNMQNAIDTAFQRRLRFVVQFPFPDEPSRERIWRKVFPAAAPTAGLDYTRLAHLNVTGGVIRNIALLAAFLAADEKSPIAMRHMLAAARTEFAKLDKPLTAAETRGW